MASQDIVAVECAATATGDTAHIMDEMLSGAKAAGGVLRRFVIPSQGDDPQAAADTEVAADAAGLQSLLDALSNADHAIIGAGTVPLSSDEAFGRLRDGCYMRARWVTLADLDGRAGAKIRLRDGQRLEDFRFPMPRREPTGRHRGLAILTPPPEMPDHDDPFADNSFFVMEEALRIMGFMPAGRILATGLYFPPIESNPMLRQQAFELGRQLVRGAISV